MCISTGDVGLGIESAGSTDGLRVLNYSRVENIHLKCMPFSIGNVSADRSFCKVIKFETFIKTRDFFYTYTDSNDQDGIPR